MKIVHALGWYFPDAIGGTEVYVAGLAARQRAAGHEVRVVAPDAAGGARSYVHEDVPVFRYPIPTDPTRSEARGDRPARGAEKLHAWIASERPEILHLHSFTTGLGLWELRAARAAGARVVATTHESTLGYICQRGTLMQWGERVCDGLCQPRKCAACILQKRGVPRALAGVAGALPFGPSETIRHNQRRQEELYRLVHRFVALTEAARSRLLLNGAPPDKVVLNRLGVGSRGAPKPGRPATAPLTIGYLGRFEAIKGVEDLAWAVASQPDLPLRFELRGPPDSAGVHEAVRRRLAGDPRVRFAPAVSSREVPAVLSAYDLLCCPSRCLEGGPTVALEAHAVGTPVIGARLGGLAEIVPDDGRLFAPADRAGLARLLFRVAADPALVDRWRRALPAPRTMDEVARDYLTLYE